MFVMNRSGFPPRTIAVLAALCGMFAGDASAPAGERYAFLVAVRQYDKAELTPLRYTENDVTELAAALKKTGYKSENVVLLTQTVGAETTRLLPLAKNIDQELRLLLGELHADDSLLLAFSGHGVQFKGDKQVYYCPADAKLKDRSTLVSLTAIYDLLGDPKVCKARTKVLLVDACRNDPQSQLNKAAGEVELEPAGVSERPPPPAGVVAFFSCSAGQKSYEHPDLKHGVFLNFVIEALGGKGDVDGDQDVTLAEVELYTTRNVQRYVRIELGRAQTPEIEGKRQGLVPLARIGERPPVIPRPSPSPMPTPPMRNDSDGKVITNSIGMKLVRIPAGEYLRGSPDSDKDALDSEKPQHRVRITKDFYLGMHEVTQGEWKSVMGTEPWKYGTSVKEGKDYAATYVSWDDAQEFVNKLSQRDGRTYRLPTEAEWEYAARGGTATRYSFGDDESKLSEYAWFDKNAGDVDEKYAHQVGLKKANPFGLHDMHGNVWEWCGDWYDEKEYAKHAGRTVQDPQGPQSGSVRVNRGGGWFDWSQLARSAYRFRGSPVFRDDFLGFRVASVPSVQ